MPGTTLHRRLALPVIGLLCVALLALLTSTNVGKQTLHTVDGPAPVTPTTSAPHDTAEQALAAPSAAGGEVRSATGAREAGSWSVQGPSDPAPSTPRSSTTLRPPSTPSTTKANMPAASGPVRGPLHTDGTLIEDADGPVLLRGINRVGLQETGSAPPITATELDHAREWGVNIIRLMVSDAYSNPACPSQIRPDYFTALDAAVNGITARGMVALLDLTTVTRTPCGPLGRWRMADSPGATTFWNTVAARYKGNNLVAFDLYNEPNNITNDEWRNGGVLVDPGLPGVQWNAAGMQQLYDAVRGTGATNLITVSGNGWASDPSPILNDGGLKGSNIVYAAHDYTCSHINEPLCTGNPANKQQDLNPLWDTLAREYPVLITEFGWPDFRDGTYNASVIRFAESHTPKWGWIAFAWDGTKDNYFILVHDLTTYAPTASGAPVKAALGGA